MLTSKIELNLSTYFSSHVCVLIFACRKYLEFSEKFANFVLIFLILILTGDSCKSRLFLLTLIPNFFPQVRTEVKLNLGISLCDFTLLLEIKYRDRCPKWENTISTENSTKLEREVYTNSLICISKLTIQPNDRKEKIVLFLNTTNTWNFSKTLKYHISICWS